MKLECKTYRTGRTHRLIYTPDRDGIADVKCHVHLPDLETTEHRLSPLGPVFFFDYTFKTLGDYVLMLEVDGKVENVLKASIEV